MLNGKNREFFVNTSQWFVVGTFFFALLIPIFYAVIRLQSVTEMNSLSAITNFFQIIGTKEALKFTLLQATFSVVVTLFIGVPLAWYLGRYEWKRIRIIRALLSVPFVMPAIVAAMGFIALIEENSLLYSMGIDLRGQTITYFGKTIQMSELTGFENPGHFIALILAHAWFNISLIIRFLEPTLSTMDPRWEEQIRLLPAGNTFLKRIKNLWIPFIGPAVACSSALCFIFSFTSFALVKWLTPNDSTLESLMAESGGTAGIYNYRVDTSEIVLSICLIQLIILLSALLITSHLQKKHSIRHAIISESSARKNRGKIGIFGRIVVSLGIVFTILPLVLTIISSFRIRKIENGNISFNYSLDAWREVWSGDNSTIALPDALLNSVTYAIFTLILSLIIGWTIASCINRLEVTGRKRAAKIVDFISLSPLAVSAVMIGLGVLIGVLRWIPELFNWFFIPVLPHVLLTTPFVVRIMLPAIRSLDSSFEEQARLLGLSPLRIWIHSKLSFLRGPLVVASSLTIAFSLGEFGATWILVRSGSWDTLSILTDQLMNQPKFNPLIYPMAMASASVLMILTFTLFLIAERMRTSGQESGF